MNPSQLAGLLGFLFVAAWIAFGFGDAILCLLGAAGFYAATALSAVSSTSPTSNNAPAPAGPAALRADRQHLDARQGNP